ncbi:hypothetical protein OIDMADRAFT_43243 [Oidiodendron maius Zn]|uniref:BZIP domain-containing protein n=1 Tax=Oidiodendron maius (strain Zn) TaxID=913774 RepID=A0A0C3DBK1_OIDMZ|nr:hypothetical protein OIDMADRAFT_43243 [Oidiodendron maius Zn]
MFRLTYSKSPTIMASTHITAGTSKASCSSASPFEDWTMVSDFTERRRIQNRNSQRKYRMKLKKRLEDLERRAEQSPVSLSQADAEIRQPVQCPLEPAQKNWKSSDTIHQLSQSGYSSRFSPPTPRTDIIVQSQSFDQNGSRTPPLYTYSVYPSPTDGICPLYLANPTSGDANLYADYIAPIPVTLPSMTRFYHSIKQQTEDMLSPYNMAYHASPEMNIHSPEMHNRPLLSHSHDHPAACLELEYHYPTTHYRCPLIRHS